MLPDEQLALLKDVLDSAQQIQGYLKNLTRDQFLEDIKTQDAVAMRFLTLGEAAGDLSEETQKLFPKLPFSLMSAQRNIIAHAYGRVNFARIYDTAQQDLKPLISELDQFFKKHH